MPICQRSPVVIIPEICDVDAAPLPCPDWSPVRLGFTSCLAPLLLGGKAVEAHESAKPLVWAVEYRVSPDSDPVYSSYDGPCTLGELPLGDWTKLNEPAACCSTRIGNVSVLPVMGVHLVYEKTIAKNCARVPKGLRYLRRALDFSLRG